MRSPTPPQIRSRPDDDRPVTEPQPTSARILDGKRIAEELLDSLAARVRARVAAGRPAPGLAVVLVGNDPASAVYVRNKRRAAEKVGIRAIDYDLPADTADEDLLALVDRLNADPAVHGILVQLPLPPQIDAQAVLNAIDPAKDVDGFHPVNAGRLATGLSALTPCTPLGCILLAKTVHDSLAGLEAVVVGRSNIVGKPVTQLLLAENATVTVTHSRTRDLPAVCRRADLLFAAVGRPEMIRAGWIKPGATVIDVGINTLTSKAEVERIFPEGSRTRVQFSEKGSVLVGDVHPEVEDVAGALTPVPGGVGPITVAMVLRNTVTAAELRATGKAAV